MFVGIVKLHLRFPGCHSLKEKRHCIQKIKGRLLGKFSVLASEVGAQDKWQRAEMGFALVSGDEGSLASFIDRILLFIEGLYVGEILDCEREIVTF